MHKYIKGVIVIAFFLGGCNTERKLFGEYTSNKSPYIFTINEDLTFSYRYKFEFSYEHSEGFWSKKGKKRITLNSYLKNRLLPLRVEEYCNDIEKEAGNSNVLNVQINIPDAEKKYYQCLIFINDSFFIKKSCDSISSLIISQQISSVFFKLTTDERIPTRFLDSLDTEKYFTKSCNYKNIKVEIVYNDTLFNYRVFKNETLKLSPKGLKFYPPKSTSWKYLPKK